MQLLTVEDNDLRKKVYNLRYQISIEEMQRNDTSADHQAKMIIEDLDTPDSTLLCVVDDNGLPIATLRINWGTFGINEKFHEIFMLNRFSDFPSQNFAFFSRLGVIKTKRNSVLLNLLFTHAYHLIRKNNIKFCFCHSRPQLRSFYKRLGFRYFGQGFSDPNLGAQQTAVLICEDSEYLQKCSFFLTDLTSTKDYPNDTQAAEWFKKYIEPDKQVAALL